MLECHRMVEQPTASVMISRLTDDEQTELMGPCSLCGSRRMREPRRWRLLVRSPGAEDMEYLACTRCRRAFRELAEIAFGDGMHGVLELQGDLPYDQGDPRRV